jgi:hypothetical protein
VRRRRRAGGLGGGIAGVEATNDHLIHGTSLHFESSLGSAPFITGRRKN